MKKKVAVKVERTFDEREEPVEFTVRAKDGTTYILQVCEFAPDDEKGWTSMNIARARLGAEADFSEATEELLEITVKKDGRLITRTELDQLGPRLKAELAVEAQRLNGLDVSAAKRAKN